jgi:cell division topological specificity factor
MSIFGWGRKSGRSDRRGSAAGSAAVARDRLTILLAHEGALGAKSDLLGLLRESIVAVICRHVTVRPDQIQMSLHRDASVSRLAIEVEIPA